MSTGVCIINRNGIALAADSAGTYISDTGNKMFYNSMDKVFSISENNICGLIAYGNMSIYNVSVEQLIKEFTLYLNSKTPFNDFFEVWQYFESYIKERYQYYKFDEAEKGYCKWFIGTFLNNWGIRIKNVATEKDADLQIGLIINDLRKYIDEHKKILGFNINKYIKTEHIDIYQDQVEAIVPELKIYPDYYNQLWDLLCEYFELSIGSESDNPTGLFFAGYGAEDAFPKYLHIEIHKIFKDKIKFIEEKRFVGNGVNSEIIPLAQGEVIYTFCRGISTNFRNLIPEKTNAIIMSHIDALSSLDFSDEQKEKIKNELSNCKAQLTNEINTEIHINNVQPIFDSVQSIALPEMAFLAESLVNITTLKRTFSLDGKQQTVGGPTDVAVLSKADGFVWIKQKHYAN